MTTSDIVQSIREHQDIIDAILAGNPSQAKGAMDKHQRKGSARVLALTPD